LAKTRWYQDRQREAFYRQAKKEGYRARSAYKLKQVNDKYMLVRKGDAVADLGAAPGGWSQVLTELVGPTGLVVGVDLQRIRPMQGATFLRGDFTLEATRDAVAEVMTKAGREKFDAVVSDMAPDMSGSYDLDQARSVHLSGLALAFAERHLKLGGGFCCKVFEGADFQEFREDVRRLFAKVYQFHPPASRKKSSEIYLVAKGFRGPLPEGAASDAEE